jgi:hypothetical protein
MNSRDPWAVIVTDSFGDIVFPRARYGHPFYTEVPSWVHYGDRDRDGGASRQLFEGAFISGDLGAPVVSGFFDSVKNAVLKYTGTTATNQFIKDHHLEPYVKLAATAVATAYGGPAAGAAAGALTGPVMSLGVKDKKQAEAGQKQVQQLSAAVQQQSPELSPAVDIAHDAIDKTATTYHVAKLVNDAKAGNPQAQQALTNLKQAADRGDVQAKQALQLAAVIYGEQSKAEAGGTVAGWVDIIGANMTNIIGAQLTALSAPGAFYGGYGYGGYGSYGRSYPSYGPLGPFIGAEQMAPPVVTPAPPVVVPGPQRTGLLAEVAPNVAPATGGIMVNKHLDDKQTLHVEICVDGKCYKTSMDLAPAIAMLMQKLATWHQGQHAQQPPPATVVSTIENAVSAAGDGMANAMVGYHVDVMTSGLLSDIGGAIGSTLRKLQPVISTVAVTAATAYGGPAAGAAAAKFAPMITNLQANALDPKGDPKKKAAAQQALARLQQEAASDPVKAQALQAANQAVKNTTIAYHVKETAQKAALGDRAAQRDLQNVVANAEAGDPAAKSTWEVIAATFADKLQHSEEGAKLWERITGRGPGTVSPTAAAGWYDIVGQWYDVVGAAIDDVREKARAHAVTKPGNAAGVLITTEGQLHGRGFRNLDDAIDWLQHITRNRGSFTYAAAYDKDDSGAYIQAEEMGRTSQPTPAPTIIPRDAPAMTSGW